MSILCPNCKAENEYGSKFCNKCGKSFNNNTENTNSTTVKTKSRGVAVLLSFFVPGLGYAYIKRYKTFALAFVFGLILIGYIFYSSNYAYLVEYSLNYVKYTFYNYSDLDYAIYRRTLSYLMYFIFWIVQLIGIYKNTNEYNDNLVNG